jgi:hypothetical protein
MRQPGQAPNGGRSLGDELKEISSPISIKYRLDDVRLPPIVQPGYTLEVRMTGDVLLKGGMAPVSLGYRNSKRSLGMGFFVSA